MAQTIEEFARDHRAHIDRLFKTGKPALFDAGEDGDVVVMDALAYQEMLDRLDLLESSEIVRQRAERYRAGEGRDAVEVLEELSRKHQAARGSISSSTISEMPQIDPD